MKIRTIAKITEEDVKEVILKHLQSVHQCVITSPDWVYDDQGYITGVEWDNPDPDLGDSESEDNTERFYS